MTFKEDLKKFKEKAFLRTHAVHNGTVSECMRSIQVGSEITGAPGQPVDVGTLRLSWQMIWESVTSTLIVTNLVYAPIIEDGTREGRSLTLRSTVGGFHSVKMTVAGFKRIVEHVTHAVTGGNP